MMGYPQMPPQGRPHRIDMLAGARNVILLHGGLGIKARRAVTDRLAAIADSDEQVLIATVRYIGEGFDDARLDTLFLTMPIS